MVFIIQLMHDMTSRVAVVTGSNKGIGLGIVKELCRRGVEIVYLTSRDVSRGLHAVEELKSEGLHPYFHQLDVTDKKSIKALADHIKKEHGGLDILINNAGVGAKSQYEVEYEDAKRVIDTNYRTLLDIQFYLFPLLNQNARVINISSECGHICNLRHAYWIKSLTKVDLTVKDINDFVNWFLDTVKNGTLNLKDFRETHILAYRISKIAMSALTRVQQKMIGRGISVNSIHPGFVETDMTQQVGLMTVDEACKSPVYLALDVDQSVKGKYFWHDRLERDWADPNFQMPAAKEVIAMAISLKMQKAQKSQ